MSNNQEESKQEENICIPYIFNPLYLIIPPSQLFNNNLCSTRDKSNMLFITFVRIVILYIIIYILYTTFTPKIKITPIQNIAYTILLVYLIFNCLLIPYVFTKKIKK
jgi:hypothetical protein